MYLNRNDLHSFSLLPTLGEQELKVWISKKVAFSILGRIERWNITYHIFGMEVATSLQVESEISKLEFPASPKRFGMEIDDQILCKIKGAPYCGCRVMIGKGACL